MPDSATMFGAGGKVFRDLDSFGDRSHAETMGDIDRAQHDDCVWRVGRNAVHDCVERNPPVGSIVRQEMPKGAVSWSAPVPAESANEGAWYNHRRSLVRSRTKQRTISYLLKN